MTDRQIFILAHAIARSRALEAVRLAPEGYCVEIKPKTRTLAQNSKLHSMCGDIAKQKLWAGEKRTAPDWKRIFVDGLIRVEGGDGLPMAPSLDYKGVVSLSEPTRHMGVRRMSDLIEFIYAWGSENDIIWTPTKGVIYAENNQE